MVTRPPGTVQKLLGFVLAVALAFGGGFLAGNWIGPEPGSDRSPAVVPDGGGHG